MKTTRRHFIAGISGIVAATAVPAAAALSDARPESLDERIQRLEQELSEALSEKWSERIEPYRAPYGNHALFFMVAHNPDEGGGKC